MDKVRALEYLGFVNLVDFEVHLDDVTLDMVITWFSATPQPSDATLQVAFNDFVSANPGPTLADLKIVAKEEIDRAAERTRQRYLTDGAGQALVYQAKALDAERYVADGYPPSLTPYPWVEAEAFIINNTGQVAADQIIVQRDAWIQLGIEVEKVRLVGKQDIMLATTENGVNVARDLAVATLDAG